MSEREDCTCTDEPLPGGIYPETWPMIDPTCPVHGEREGDK